MPNNIQTTTQLYLFHMLAKQCSKFSKLDFNSTWIENIQMCKLDLEKAEEPRDQIANMHWIIEKAREFQKNIYFGFIDSVKAFDCLDHNCGKFFKRWEYQITLPASWAFCMQVKKQQL